jgi:uncharacterized membrane protein YphA (DoxX/SURF4 family)
MKTTTKVFLVLLRIAVGWHFLYEGLFKIDSDGAPEPLASSRFFLQASVGRLRDDLAAGAAFDRIDRWNDEVVKYFKSRDNALSEEQKVRLALLCEKIKQEAPAGFDWFYVHEEVLGLAAGPQASPRFSAAPFLKSASGPFRPLFRGLVTDADGLERLTRESVAARIDARYREIAGHFSLTAEQQSKLRVARDQIKTSVAAVLADPAFTTRLADYRVMRDRVRADAARLDAPFTGERLEADRGKLDLIAAELLAFVNEPLTELEAQTQALLSADQMRAGPPPPAGETRFLNWMVKWGLVGVGVCLLAGLFTQPAALGAVTFLAMFYFAAPPWPGLPVAAGDGHYLIVNRNLIELFAALALATLPTGCWAGLDFWIHRFTTAAVARHEEPALAIAVR